VSAGAGARPISGATLRLGTRALDTRHGRFTLHLFRDLAAARPAMVLAAGDLTSPSPLLARVHSSCLTSECLMGRDCDCAEQLDAALARIAQAGRGALVYLMQEGRGAGLSAKARDRMLVQASVGRLTTFDAYAEMGLPPDLRRYGAVASIFALLGVRGPLRLLTNNPQKLSALARALAGERLAIEGCEPVAGSRSPFNRDYLRAKRSSGHTLERPDRAPGARPPEAVRAFDPTPHAIDSGRLVTASYFLPIGGRAGAVDWFRLTVLMERASGHESVVLSHGALERPAALPLPAPDRWIPMSLLDRLPTAEASGRAALTRALDALRARRTECVGVAFADAALCTPQRAGNAFSEAKAGAQGDARA